MGCGQLLFLFFQIKGQRCLHLAAYAIDFYIALLFGMISTRSIFIVYDKRSSDLSSSNRVQHQEETHVVSRLTMENMSLASRCHEVIAQVASPISLHRIFRIRIMKRKHPSQHCRSNVNVDTVLCHYPPSR